MAVLRIDHFGKDAARGVRGSSAKVDDVDDSYEFTQSRSGLLQLRKTHSRYAPGPECLLLKRSTDPLRHELVAQGDRETPGVEPNDEQYARPLAVSDLVRLLDDMGLPEDQGSRSLPRC